MHQHWSTIKKLIWQKVSLAAGAVTKTVTGTSPLSLTNAIAGNLVSLKQTGKCTQASDPTPNSPVDIKCNNGTLKWDAVNEQVYIDGTSEVITVSATGAADQTAITVDLFGAGDVGDEQDIITGAITRKCVIHVLDGTEHWQVGNDHTLMSDSFTDFPFPGQISQPICTHFKGTTHYGESLLDNEIVCRGNTMRRLQLRADQFRKSEWQETVATFKAFLADQYSAGTPVIIVYPLKNETTDTTTAQPLTVEDGDNTITVTAEVSGIELEAKYHATN